MSINNIKNKLKQTSKKDTSWIDKAKWRKVNEAWLDISFDIAVRVMSALKANKSINVFPSNQKELAKEMGCSAQYVNKLLKGSENLQLETITKLERILNIKLIEAPKTSVVSSRGLPYLTFDSFSESFNELISSSFINNDIIISSLFDNNKEPMTVGKVQLNYNSPLIEEQKDTYKCPSVEYLKVA